ncbi:MAG: hypothetical protein IJU20_08170 [Clostridia bacterium]|nr:hypothetical protein [Clostridia bacterium]
MNAKMNRIAAAPCAPAMERIKYELPYAQAISRSRNGLYDALIEEALDALCRSLDEQGCITVQAAQKCEETLLPMQKDAKAYTVHFAGHAHIDMNWMWGYNETVAVALDTFRTVIKLMNQFPEFKFSQSQTSTYEIVEKFDPVLFEQIKEKIREGRWEVSASTWVEADKNMMDYSSMIRHLLYTRAYMKEKFGLDEKDVQIDFEPDTFGHSRFVPEVLALGGVKYYYHMRGNMPKDGKDLHLWQSPSGKTVLMHREIEGYGGPVEYGFLSRVPEECDRNGIHQRLKLYGVGDHGGGPTRRDIERILDLGKWPIAPQARLSTYREYFAAVEAEGQTFPVLNEEQNYVFTGCYTSQAAIKGGNRRIERALYASEAASALGKVLVNAHPYDYRTAWTHTLFNQFHDILTGSGVADTRHFAMGRYQEGMGYAYAGRSRALNEIASAVDTSVFGPIDDPASYAEGAGVGYRGDAQWTSAYGGDPDIRAVACGGTKRIFVLFNPTMRERNERFKLTLWDFPGDDSTLCVRTADGEELPVELLDNGTWWLHQYRNIQTRVKIPPLGYTTVAVEHGGRTIPPVYSTRDRTENYPDWKLENEYIRVCFNDQMEIVSFVDKQSGRELLKSGAGYFSLVYQDPYIDSGSGMPGNAWSECYPVMEQNLNRTCPVFTTAKPEGTLYPCYGYRILYNQSEIRVTVGLGQGDRFLTLQVGAEWREAFAEKKGIPALRFILPVEGEIEDFVSRVPGGYLSRKPEQHDVPAVGCAAVQTASGGLALLSDATYGFRVKDGALSTSLLRNSNNPDNCPELGFRQWKLGIAPCSVDPVDLSELNDAFSNTCFYVGTDSHRGSLPAADSLLEISPFLELSGLKIAEDGNGLILHVFNVTDKAEKGQIVCKKPIACAGLTEVTEKEICALETTENRVELDFAPGELRVIRLVFA